MKATDNGTPTKEQFIAMTAKYIGTSGTQYTLKDNTDGSVVYNVTQGTDTISSRIQYSPSYHKPWYFYKRYRLSGVIVSGCGDSLQEAVDESKEEWDERVL